MRNTLRPLALALSFPLMIVSPGAFAGEGKAEVPMRDPWVPPATRAAAASAPVTRGAALHSQVETKLRQSFDAADVDKTGSITLQQAKAANLGLIANNFDQIDARRTGRVSFEDVKRFLKGRGASTL